ncbi:MAG: hypothetical protein PHD32_05765 [Eubacteriales bacterium]|nr:hypothetical protein [Eubacteriales bacterium]
MEWLSDAIAFGRLTKLATFGESPESILMSAMLCSMRVWEGCRDPSQVMIVERLAAIYGRQSEPLWEALRGAGQTEQECLQTGNERERLRGALLLVQRAGFLSKEEAALRQTNLTKRDCPYPEQYRAYYVALRQYYQLAVNLDCAYEEAWRQAEQWHAQAEEACADLWRSYRES